MNFGGFLAYCILLTGFWGQVYWIAHNHFHDDRHLKAALKREVLRNTELQLSYEVLKEKKTFIEGTETSARGLASVTNYKELFSQARSAFDQKDYVTSLKLFNKIVDSGVETPYSVKTYLLKAESEYQIGEKENAVLTIRKMMRLYPEKEETGHALLKLAGIYRDQKMTEEAIDTYKTIIRTFPQKELVDDARRKLGSLEP